MFEVPPVVQNRARAAGAQDWLDGLPGLIGHLESEWNMTVGDQYDGGTEAFVAQSIDARGRPSVLKLLIPGDNVATHNEIKVLELAGGRGCAKLYRSDAELGALLIERLGASIFDLRLPIARRHEILCDIAQDLWQPAPDSGFRTGAAKAAWLQDVISARWEALDRPCTERAVDHALRCAERRIAAHDNERARLVHGDVHQWNALQSDGGFKLVDPDGLLAEPEYDLGIIMREDPVELLADRDLRTRSRWLAHRTGLDEIAIWEWGVIERVSTGLLCAEIDLQPVGAEMLEVADFAAIHS